MNVAQTDFCNCNKVFNHVDKIQVTGKRFRLLLRRLMWGNILFSYLQGICAHVDLMGFEDGIAIVSLESPCVMHFSRADSASLSSTTEAQPAPTAKVPVYLAPGSLVIMSGEARYLWRHEINRKPGFQVWQDQEIEQKRRTSITLRKLCRTE